MEATIVIMWKPKRYRQSLALFYSYMPFISEDIYIIIHTLLLEYLTMAWVQSVLSCICWTHLLKEEFKKITEEMEETLNAVNNVQQDAERETRDTTNSIEHHRMRHLELCRIVSKYDSGVSVYLLFLFLLSIPIIIILMYALGGLDRDVADVDDSSLSFWLSIIYLLFFVLVLVSVTVSGAALAEAVSTNCLTSCKKTYRLRSFSLSYQKKDRSGDACQSSFWNDTGYEDYRFTNI